MPRLCHNSSAQPHVAPFHVAAGMTNAGAMPIHALLSRSRTVLAITQIELQWRAVASGTANCIIAHAHM